MSINNIGSTTNQTAQRAGEGSTVESQAETSQRTKAVTAAGGADTVNITSTGAKLQQVADAAANAPDIDVKRVEAIKRAIDSGTFEVDAKRVAEKMIAFDSVVSKAGR